MAENEVQLKTTSKRPPKTELQKNYSKIASYVGEWGQGQNKERLLGNIHRNLLGVDKLGKLRPPEDLAYFLLICNQYDLNPLKKEIYPVYQRQNQGTKEKPNWVEKLEPIVSIHGLRTLARRAKNPTYAYTGQAKFTFKDNEEKQLDSATVEVFGYFGSAGNQIQKVGEFTAYMEEFAKTYNGNPQGNWARMPRVMLAKCAEANAIRMAFSLGGVYIGEEFTGESEEKTDD